MGGHCLARALGMLLALSAAPGAFAGDTGFRVCNQTGGSIEVAKALNTGATDGQHQIIISEGWYQVRDGQCVYLWTGELKYRYYLIYAQNKSVGEEWAGEIPICVSRSAFTIRSDTCGPEYYRRNFIQVDTGDASGWTFAFE